MLIHQFRRNLHLFRRTLRCFTTTCYDLGLGLGELNDLCHSLLIFAVLLLVFHQIFYDLLIPQLHVQGIREQGLQITELYLVPVVCPLQLFELGLPFD